jgi:hypothetical protein
VPTTDDSPKYDAAHRSVPGKVLALFQVRVVVCVHGVSDLPCALH